MSGSDVRRIRERLGLTQQQLAENVGVHKNTVARWERDELGIRGSAVKLLEHMAREQVSRDTDAA